jgi:hypothetical protein
VAEAHRVVECVVPLFVFSTFPGAMVVTPEAVRTGA